MSSELLKLLPKEVVERELKKAKEKAANQVLILFDKVQNDSLSIPDLAKTVGISEDIVRIIKAKWMLQSGKPMPEIVSVTGLTSAKIKSIHIERLLILGLSTEEISKQAKVSFRKIYKVRAKLIKKGFLEKPAYSEYKNISQTYLILSSSNTR